MAEPADADALRARFFDPYPGYAALRERGLYRDDHGVWQAARYAEVDAILKDRRFGKQPPPGTEHRTNAPNQDADRHSILNLDPPDHTRLRALMSKAFDARRMASMRPAITALVDRILADKRPHGQMEVMREFAFPIPATIISDMLGIPADERDAFAALSNELIETGSGVELGVDMAALAARNARARERFDDYLTKLFAAKRARPGDDLTTALIRAEDEDGRLDEIELTENVRLLFIAGHETTVNLIGNALVALHRNPEQLALLKADPALMPAAVEEFLRFDSSVQRLPRVAQEDVTLSGQTIRAGETVMCVLGAANRDERVWSQPDALDLQRPLTRAKSFGGGIHFCLGAQLARTETEVALTRLFETLPDFEITNLHALEYPLNVFFRGPRTLRARWRT